MIKVRPIKVGFNPDFPPFNFIENGTPSGIVIDRVIKAFHDAKIDFEFVSLPLTELTKNLLEGEYEITYSLKCTYRKNALNSEDALNHMKPFIELEEDEVQVLSYKANYVGKKNER